MRNFLCGLAKGLDGLRSKASSALPEYYKINPRECVAAGALGGSLIVVGFCVAKNNEVEGGGKDNSFFPPMPG
jgi:hypothetical protein